MKHNYIMNKLLFSVNMSVCVYVYVRIPFRSTRLLWFKAFDTTFGLSDMSWHRKQWANGKPCAAATVIFIIQYEHRMQTFLIDNSKIDTFVKQVTIEHMRQTKEDEREYREKKKNWLNEKQQRNGT